MTMLPMHTRSCLAPLAAVLACSLAALNLQAGETLRFNRDIRPILSNHCFQCHGPDLKKGGLNLQSRNAAVKPLRSGQPALVPGKSAASRLIQRVATTGDSERMPPKGKGQPLAKEEIEKLRVWIDQGAVYEEHWAYVKPQRPDRPAVKNTTWPRNDLDYFVLARLEREGLAPAPEADRATLFRRLHLDLTGLPPSVAEVEAFLQDTRPDAYEKVVERLLAAPAYGEHQARPWLDMARYADTNGYEKDERRTIWPYRDWVIHAFNRDLPFDQFTVEQLAGDLLPNATLEQKIATGFHRNTMVNTEGGTDDEEFRVAALVDRVNTTMAVWMGTTMNCAQCHNHKFDPFSQKNFCQLLAFFNGTTDGGRGNDPVLPVPTAEETARRDRLRAETARRAAALLAPDPLLTAALLRPTRQRLEVLGKEQAALKPVTTLVLQELPKLRPTHLMVRGNHKNLGEAVTPGVPAVWHPLRPGQPLNRLTFARWLVDPDNPLAGRVTMNRIWARYFGRGLVETSEDFGARGEPPTQPEVLDWLATELVRQKWSLKALHRAIVTSATYRQSAHASRALYERDPYNVLLARGPRFRLDAEMVRDNALAIAGLLERRIGGPSVFPYQPEGVWFNPYSADRWVLSSNGNQYRRGLYTFWRRTAPYAAFMAFDAPSREVCTERRSRTNTPLQALATLNDKAFVECAAGLARRMMREAQGGPPERTAYGFRLCVSRRPSAVEMEQLLRLYRDALTKYRKDTAAAKALAASGLPVPTDLETAELAAWTVVANVLLNLDETIAKG